ncbi:MULTISPECIES: signal recognition particle-docking protein FtsY [unclassified Ensifer]|uniref:signal recognition particle-docking protein FtsY n=1 Tax=unclassified Ensifer TaxID=2633371 RepID=UPI00081386BD|nr:MULTISPECIES: signal recognition particle-docking protein FtsY [unclassified Ensifer]OCP18041.1 signal recognition particle-docking protein FtsY [Ensifer sp. LC384]OCP27650.1 signal recognition particle-docking protein FtsY [Ensifer sp. LC54]
MAIGFIKKIFSFGKGTVEETKPQDAAPEADAAAAAPAEAQPAPKPAVPEEIAPVDVLVDELVAEQPAAEETSEELLEPLSDLEALPLSVEDPILPAEIETAGGPAPDEARGDEDVVVGNEAVASVEPAAEQEELSPAAQEALEAYAALQETVPEEPPVEPEDLAEQEELAAVEDRPIGGDASHDATADSEPAAEIIEESDSVPEAPVIEAPVFDAPVAETPVAASLPKGFASAAERAMEEPVAAPQPKLSWYQRLRRGLARTSSQLTGQIASLFTKRKLDEATLQDLEDLLIQADLGVETAMRITDTLASERYGKDVSGEDVSRIMAGEITKVLSPVAKPLELDLSHKPHVILVVGVNGTGKTTTIGKLAAKLSGAGLKVMLAAGDTFRAAAIEQLKIWAERTKSDIVSSKLGADAAGLAYEAFQQAREKKADVLIIDTAGRLQNKAELMAELEKIVRVLGKLDPDAPHTVLQTLDATTGQNALQQVEIFRNVAGVSGLIMTKLDGTARGGILVAISAKHKLPVYFIGVGEGIDDLEPFEARDFAEAIAGVAA